MSWLSELFKTPKQYHAERVAEAQEETARLANVAAEAAALAEEIKIYPVRGEIESVKTEIKNTQTKSLTLLAMTEPERKQAITHLQFDLQKLEREYEREKNGLGIMGEYLLSRPGQIVAEPELVAAEQSDNSGVLLTLGILGLIIYRSLR